MGKRSNELHSPCGRGRRLASGEDGDGQESDGGQHEEGTGEMKALEEHGRQVGNPEGQRGAGTGSLGFVDKNRGRERKQGGSDLD